MNLLLLRGQFNPAVIELEERDHYMDCLGDADSGNILPLTEFIAQKLVDTQNTLRTLGRFH